MHDKLIRLKKKLERELTSLEARMSPDAEYGFHSYIEPDSRSTNLSGNDRHFSEIDKGIEAGTIQQPRPESFGVPSGVNEQELLKLKSDLKRELFEKEGLLASYNGQARELESLRSSFKERQDQFNDLKQKIHKNEDNMAVFVNNLGKRIRLLEKENDMLQNKCIEQNKSNSAFADEIKFLKSELLGYQKKETEQRETENGLLRKITEKEEETTILSSKINKLEIDRSRLIEEIRKMNLENTLKEEFRKFNKNRSLAGKLVKWLGSPLLDLNTGKS